MKPPKKGSVLSKQASPRELAEILLTKAIHDFRLAELAVDEIPEHIGDQAFCARLQESVEKCTKAVLCWKTGDYPKIHNLSRLFLALSDVGHPVPVQFSNLKDLTPYAAQERYETPLSKSSVDRHFVLNLVSEFHIWIETILI